MEYILKSLTHGNCSDTSWITGLFPFIFISFFLSLKAFHYCERIAKAVCRNPANYSATLVGQLLNVSEQLKHHDPQVQTGTLHPNNLRWLETLRNVDARFLVLYLLCNLSNNNLNFK